MIVKKTSLTLSILLLFATNAWAEFKTIECFFEDSIFSERYTFDPELPDAQKQNFKDGKCKSCIIKPVKVTVFPSYYRFVFKDISEFNGKLMSIETLDLSRKDLTFTMKRQWFIMTSPDTHFKGKCELVEVDTSDNIL